MIIAIPVILVVFDLSMIVLGVQQNDSTCREVARVAANGNPLDAQSRAQMIIRKANMQTSGYVSNFKLLKLTNTVTAATIARLGTYGGQLKGELTAQTDVSVNSFVVRWAIGGTNPMHFVSEQTFPVTYVVPNTTQSQTGP